MSSMRSNSAKICRQNNKNNFLFHQLLQCIVNTTQLAMEGWALSEFCAYILLEFPFTMSLALHVVTVRKK